MEINKIYFVITKPYYVLIIKYNLLHKLLMNNQ